MADKAAIAVDMGGTKIAGSVVDKGGRMLARLKVETPSGVDAVVVAIKDLAAKLIGLPEAKEVEIAGIGLAVAGTVDFNSGTIVNSPNLFIRDLKLRTIIESEFGLTTQLDNDGNLAALGEREFGAAIGKNEVVGLTLGTGIGGGLILNGCLYRGATGSAAEIGHMVVQADGPRCNCGSHGCFEELASGRALVRVAMEKVARDRDSKILELAGGTADGIAGPVITEAARLGDRVALDAFAEVGYWLGVGLNSIINIFNPELIVLGGGMAEAGELILAPAKQEIAKRALSPNKEVAEIALAKLGNDAGMLGAAALVFDSLSG